MRFMKPTVTASTFATRRPATTLRARVASFLAVAVTVAGIGISAAVAPAAAADLPSSDATLSNLSFTADGKPQGFFPAFTPTWTEFSVSLRAEQLAFGCSFTKSDAGATAVVAPACSSVVFRKNVYETKLVTITVTAADRSSVFVYKVTVVHSLPINSKVALKNISSKGYKLSPKFDGKKSLFYKITTKPRASRVTIGASALGATKATTLNPKTWSTNGLNIVTIQTKNGKLSGAYTVAILVPAYPTATQSNIQDFTGGFSVDVSTANGTVDMRKTTAVLALKQKAACYEPGQPTLATTKSGAITTIYVTNVGPGCAVSLTTTILPGLNFLPIAPLVTKRTVLNQIDWSATSPVGTLDGFTADFSVLNAEVTCTVAGSTKNYCTFSRNADENARRDGQLKLTGQALDTNQTVTVKFTPDAATAPKTPITVTARTLKDVAHLDLTSTTVQPSGFSVGATLKPGTLVTARIQLAGASATSATCISKSSPRLREVGSDTAASTLDLASTTTDKVTTVYAVGVYTDCLAQITMNVTGNTGYATPATAAEQQKTAIGTGGEAVASLSRSIQRTADGFIVTYSTFGGTIDCPRLTDSNKAGRISVACSGGTITVSGALPGETVSLDVVFNTDAGFKAPVGALSFTGQANFGVATLKAGADSVSKLGEGFRFNVAGVHCTPTVEISDYNTTSTPTVSLKNGIATVVGMKFDPTNPGADRVATVLVGCTPDTGYDAPDPVSVTGMTAAFNGVFNIAPPTLTVDCLTVTCPTFTTVPGTMTLHTSIVDWVFPPTSKIEFQYSWERSIKTDPTQVCTSFEAIPDETTDFYMSLPAASDTCVRAWVTPILTDQIGNILKGDPVATNNVPVEIKPSYQRINGLPHVSAPDGAVTFGTPVTSTIGYWNGLAGATATYKWQRCDVTGAANLEVAQTMQPDQPQPSIVTDCSSHWTDIDPKAHATATSQTMYVSEDQIGTNLRAVVTVTNALGTATMESDIFAVPATTEAIATVTGATPKNVGAPGIKAAWNDTIVLGRPLEVAATGRWSYAAGLRVNWEWQYRADANAGWDTSDYYVNEQSVAYPNSWGATTFAGDYRVVEFLVDADGNTVVDGNGNRVEGYSTVIHVDAP